MKAKIPESKATSLPGLKRGGKAVISSKVQNDMSGMPQPARNLMPRHKDNKTVSRNGPRPA